MSFTLRFTHSQPKAYDSGVMIPDTDNDQDHLPQLSTFNRAGDLEMIKLHSPVETPNEIVLRLALKPLPIFMLTASMRTEDVERAFDLGANSFLVKPTSLAVA